MLFGVGRPQFAPPTKEPIMTVSAVSSVARTVSSPVPVAVATPRWTMDASHSHVGFAVRHLMISNVRGEFTKLEGTAAYDAERPEATSVEVKIDVASINTREEKRDAHLRSADFFDAEHFPHLTFVSTGARRSAAAGSSSSVTSRSTASRARSRSRSRTSRPRAATPTAMSASARRRRPRSAAPTSACAGTRRSKPAAWSSATRSRSRSRSS